MAEIDKIQNLRYMHMDNVKRVSMNEIGSHVSWLNGYYRLGSQQLLVSMCQFGRDEKAWCRS